jgi:hypothetical protein
MKENVNLNIGKRILQIAFALVMAAVYATLGTILLLSGIAFLLGIESLEILTFSGEMPPMVFLAIADIILGIGAIIAAGVISIIGLRQKNSSLNKIH